MAYSTVGESQHSRRTPALPRPMLIGIVAVAITKLADAVTTYAGIQAGYAEANPVPAAIFQSIGVVPGLIVLTVLSIALIVFVIEAGASVCQRINATRKFVPWLRVAWYGLVVAVHVMVAGHNAALIGGWV